LSFNTIQWKKTNHQCSISAPERIEYGIERNSFTIPLFYSTTDENGNKGQRIPLHHFMPMNAALSERISSDMLSYPCAKRVYQMTIS
jgi:hypothetical protein